MVAGQVSRGDFGPKTGENVFSGGTIDQSPSVSLSRAALLSGTTLSRGHDRHELNSQSTTDSPVRKDRRVRRLHRKLPSRENSAHRPNIMRRVGDKYGNATRVHTCLDFNLRDAQPAPSFHRWNSPAVRISKKLNWMIAYFGVRLRNAAFVFINCCIIRTTHVNGRENARHVFQ